MLFGYCFNGVPPGPSALSRHQSAASKFGDAASLFFGPIQCYICRGRSVVRTRLIKFKTSALNFCKAPDSPDGPFNRSGPSRMNETIQVVHSPSSLLERPLDRPEYRWILRTDSPISRRGLSGALKFLRMIAVVKTVQKPLNQCHGYPAVESDMWNYAVDPDHANHKLG